MGVHANSAQGGLDQLLSDWKPPLVVVLDHSDVWSHLKSASPRTLLVGRLPLSGEPDWNDPAINAVKAARKHCDAVLPAAERMGKTYDFWQGVNEPVVQSADAMKRLADFEAERARIMSGHGFRIVVGSFGVGNPPQLAWWRDFLPALEAARQFRGALALHEYAWPSLDHESPWYLLRHRKVYKGEPDQNWSGFPAHLAGIPLLITECGLDALIVQPKPQGWRALHGHEAGRYLQQLAWYDVELVKDPYVLGAAIYCCCPPDDPQWASYNIWPDVARVLAQEARPVYRPAWDVAPAPAEEPSAPAGTEPQEGALPALPPVPEVRAPSPPGPPPDDRLGEVVQRLDRILALLQERGRKGKR